MTIADLIQFHRYGSIRLTSDRIRGIEGWTWYHFLFFKCLFKEKNQFSFHLASYCVMHLSRWNEDYIFNYSELCSLTGVYWLNVPFNFPAATCFPFGLQQTEKETEYIYYIWATWQNRDVKILVSVSHSLHVMPSESGRLDCTLTLSVTSKIIILPSERQVANMDARAGLHFRSCTRVPGGAGGCSDAKGNFCGFAWKDKHKLWSWKNTKCLNWYNVGVTSSWDPAHSHLMEDYNLKLFPCNNITHLP